MPVIDIHHHAVPRRFTDTVRRQGRGFGFELRSRADGGVWLEGPGADFRTRPSMTDLDLRREQAQSAGIEIAMTTLLPTILFYNLDERSATWFAEAVNEALLGDAEESGGWCKTVAYVPLQHPKLAASTLARLAGEDDVRAVGIGTNVGGRNLDDPGLDPFWAAAEGAGTLIFVHPHDRITDERLASYHLRNLIGNPLETTIAMAGIIFGGVLDRFPGLKLCFAHTGGYVPWIQGRWRHGHRVREETRVNGIGDDVKDYVDMLYFDTVIHDQAGLRHAAEVVGVDHLLFGTDCPADMADMNQIPKIRDFGGFSDADADRILGGNAARLLGL